MTLTNAKQSHIENPVHPNPPYIHMYICSCISHMLLCSPNSPNCQIAKACLSFLQGLQSLEPPAISSFYAQLCCTATSPAPSSTMCQQVSLHHYTAGLQTAAALQQKAVKPSTNKARHAVVTELTSWLQQLNMPTKSMQTVMPYWYSLCNNGYPIMQGQLPAQLSSLQHETA